MAYVAVEKLCNLVILGSNSRDTRGEKHFLTIVDDMERVHTILVRSAPEIAILKVQGDMSEIFTFVAAYHLISKATRWKQ